ncbi:MAG: hypothetical protein ACKO6B_11215, partial [Planctomycetia bacterium]
LSRVSPRQVWTKSGKPSNIVDSSIVPREFGMSGWRFRRNGEALTIEVLMDSLPDVLLFEVTVEPGQRLTLPEKALEEVGAGRWLVSIRRSAGQDVTAAGSHANSGLAGEIRGHDAFLRSYSDEDESLYDDCAAG